MTPQCTIHCGNALTVLRTLPDQSVHCCCTSPPYWGLRDYGTAKWIGGDPNCKHVASDRYYTEKTAAKSSGEAFSAPGQANIERIKNGRWRESGHCTVCGAIKEDQQLGQEKTPEEFVSNLVAVCREIKRVLRDDGTLWLNISDSYARNPGKGVKFEGRNGLHNQQAAESNCGPSIPQGMKEKDLVGIPWATAFALRADGWYLRSEITWCKKAPMPESVLDRPTSATEKIFLLTKSPRYSYDAEAVRNPPSESFLNDPRWQKGSTDKNLKDGYDAAGAQNPKKLHRMFDKQRGHSRRHAGFNDRWDDMPKDQQMAFGSNMRNFWVLGPEPYPESHFATFPTEVPRRCILAGTSAKGCCVNCGAPYVRITERHTSFQGGSGKAGRTAEEVNGSGKHRNGADGKNIKLGPCVQSRTLDWEATCECAADVVPCTVLDPFGGSGTTGEVALELGRNAILIELNPANVELCRARCNVTPGLPLA